MFTVSIGKAETSCPDKITLTSGMVKAVQVAFTFSEEWDGFNRIAVFSNGSTTVDVTLDEEDKCHIPHEVLATAGKDVSVGVYGSKGEGDDYVAIPTAKCSLGKVVEGVDPSGEEPSSPTPTAWDELNIKVENLSKEIIDARNNAYTKDESDLLLDAHSIALRKTVSLKGDELEGKKDAEHIHVMSATNKNAVVFNEEYTHTGRYFGYVGVKNLSGLGYACLVAEIDIDTDFDMSKARIQAYYQETIGGANKAEGTLIGIPMNGKNYIIYPLTLTSSKPVRGFYFDAQGTNTPTVKITLRDVRVYQKQTVRRGVSTTGLKDWKCEIYNEVGAVVSEIGEHCIIPRGTTVEAISLSNPMDAEILLYKPKDSVFATKEEVSNLSEQVSGVLSGKGLTFMQYGAGVKIPLEPNCLYYLRCNKDTIYYYKNGEKLSQYTSGFGDGLVMMASNIFQGAHVNFFAAPSTGFMDYSMNGYTITTTDGDDVYAMSSSDVVNVWKFKA